MLRTIEGAIVDMIRRQYVMLTKFQPLPNCRGDFIEDSKQYMLESTPPQRLSKHMKADSSMNFISRRMAWSMLLIVVLVSLAIVIMPVWIIQPFKPQTARGLAISFFLRSWSPLATLVALAAALVLTAKLWRGSRWWRRGVLIITILPLLAVAWFARKNHFEWMFHPLANTAYAKPENSPFNNDSDMVLAVQNNGEAVAYPVRLMAYHHVVQDTVGGTPIVATY